jgi:superfamily II DNA or RNA helicase
VLRLHPTRYCYTGDASPSTPGGITVIYKDLIADEPRTSQVIADVAAALSQGRNCLVLTNWTAHLDKLADALRAMGHDPVILRGGMGARDRAAALARLQPQPGSSPLLVVATGPYAGEGFDCPALDTLFLTAPIAQKGRLVQYAGRILRPYDGKTTAEVHDYHDELTGVLASSLAKRAPGLHQPRLPRPPQTPFHTKRGLSCVESPAGRTAIMKRIVVRLSGMPFDPTYEIDDDTIAVGDLVRVPGSDSSFIEDGEIGTVVALGSSYTGPCKRVNRAT